MSDRSNERVKWWEAVVACLIMLGYLLWRVLLCPFHYIRFKCSRRYRDVGGKFKFWESPDHRSALYGRVMKSGLPIEYVYREDPWQESWFIMKDTLLVVDARLPVLSNGKVVYDCGCYALDGTCEDVVRYRPLAEKQEYCVNGFLSFDRTHPCRTAVLFFGRDQVKKRLGEEGVRLLEREADVVLYDRGQLGTAIREWAESRDGAGRCVPPREESVR